MNLEPRLDKKSRRARNKKEEERKRLDRGYFSTCFRIFRFLKSAINVGGARDENERDK